jgi:outer membrane protein assembly factor BamA
VYDFLPEENVVEGKGKFKSELSNRTTVNRYERRSFKYDIYKPGLSAAYNRDDGVFLGAGIRYIHHGFRKEPFKIKHEASAHVALATKAFMFNYNIEAIDVVGRADLLMETNLRLPQNTINFFGLGNESKYEVSDGKGIRFYRTRFDHANASVLLRNNLTPDVTVSYGPSLYYYHATGNDNRERIITVDPKGLDTAFLFRPKVYLGPRVQLLIDNRNDSIMPSRGVRWQTDIQHFEGVGEYSTDFTRINTDLSIYISSNAPPKLVIALRFGAGFNFGTYEFYNAQFLSGTQNLRGYRKFRFAGDKMFYNNVEVRYKLADLRTYLLPGSIGLLAFHDLGRVWYSGEDSKRWHSGYGIGLWLAPANRLVATASYTRSREGGLPVVSLGFQF